MQPFWRWLRASIAPDGVPDVLLAFSAGALAWLFTNFLKSILN
jgi:hypothetical protein